MSVTIRIVVRAPWVKSAYALADKSAAAFTKSVAAVGRIPSLIDASITPAAITALALGFWRLTTDLGWTEWFPISNGFFSHWQAWIGLAVALKFVAATVVAKIGMQPRAPEHR